MAAVNRLAGTLIASGDYIPVGFVAGAGGDASAANQDEQTALLTTIDTAVNGTLDVGVNGVVDVVTQVDGADVAVGNPMWVRQVALSSVDLPLVAGTIAHGTADTGNPVKIGGKAVTAAPTAVTANARVDAIFTLTGKQVVQPYALPSSHVSGTTAAITGTTTTQVIAAPAAGLKLYITHILVQNSDATVGTWVILEEETSGTDLYQVYAGALGGGASITLPTPIVMPTAAKGLFALCETTSAEVRVSASGYTAP